MPRSGKSVSEGVIIPKSFPGVKQESRGVGIAVEIRHGLRLIVDVVHRALSKEELGTRQNSRNFFVLLLLLRDKSIYNIPFFYEDLSLAVNVGI